MEIEEFIRPLPFDFFTEAIKENSIAEYVRTSIDEEIGKTSVVILSIPEYRNSHFSYTQEDPFYLEIRRHLYSLYKNNWKQPLYDLGAVVPGETIEDTLFALHQITAQLSEKRVNLIILGGSQALTYTIYKALYKKYINIGTLDKRLDISSIDQEVNADNFIAKMILDEEQKLVNYINIGNQVPYNAAEEMDILEQLNFETLRLGKIAEDITLSEPLLRNTNILSVDMEVVQQNLFRNTFGSTANGLNGREICGIMRYAGLSEDLFTLHIANFYSDTSNQDHTLIAEMLWYFIDAKNNLKKDGQIETYRVQYLDQEIVFLRSKNSERWWIEVMIEGILKRVPCSEKDYLDTLNGEISERWLRFYKRFY